MRTILAAAVAAPGCLTKETTRTTRVMWEKLFRTACLGHNPIWE